MAIIVEEDKKKFGHLANILTWVVIVAAAGAAIYYIFFSRPDLVPITTPKSVEEAQQLLSINITPEEIVQSPQFQALRQYVTPIVLQTAGKTNPFLP